MNKEDLKTLGNVVANVLGFVLVVLMLSLISYTYQLGKYGSAGTTYINIFGVKVFYPLPGEPNCTTQEMRAELVEAKQHGFIGGDSTNYYLRFTIDKYQKAFQVYSSDVVYFSPDNLYKVTVCDGEITNYEKEN